VESLFQEMDLVLRKYQKLIQLAQIHFMEVLPRKLPLYQNKRKFKVVLLLPLLVVEELEQ
jgi:hypothetical protein